MKFDQDLCLKLQYDFGKMNSTLGSVVPLAMFYTEGGFFLSRDEVFLAENKAICLAKLRTKKAGRLLYSIVKTWRSFFA